MQALFKTIRLHSMLAAMLYVGIFLYVIHAVKHNTVDFLFLLLLSGALGGVVSTYLRVKNLPLMEGKDVVVRKLAVLQVYITPLISAIFGFLLYLLFASGILSGGLFPKFSGLDMTFESANLMTKNVKISTNLDAVKALIWAFIAGFSERMVPNILDTMTQGLEKKQTDKSG